LHSYKIILPCIFDFFYRSAKKVFAEITVRNNLDFGYTAGAVNGADAYEKNAFQQKCYVNFYGYIIFCFFTSTMPCKRRKSSVEIILSE